MRNLRDARFTQRAFRSVVGTLIGVSIPLAAIMCGGTTDSSMMMMCTAPPDAAGLTCNTMFYVKGCASSFTTVNDCVKICGGGSTCKVDGNDVECTVRCTVDGRRPPELACEFESALTIEAHFARTAFFERASADAFDILARELRTHGAPARLVASARRARKDELDHARRARRLARKTRVRQTPVPTTDATRGLFDIALDNATEGCARETFGALLGFAQAERAVGAPRRFYERIARDEARHASLSWRLHAWLMTKLTADEKKEVSRVLEESLAGVRALHSPLDSTLGIPDEATCAALASALRQLADRT